MRSAYIIILTLLCSAPCVCQDASAGCVVIGVVGKWYFLSPKKTSGEKSRISFGTKCDASPNSQWKLQRDTDEKDSTFGSITLLIGGQRVTYSCDDARTLPDHNQAGCEKLIPLSLAMQPHQQTVGWLQSIQNLLADSPDRYYAAVSRDVGELQDAVISHTGSSIDLQPVFSAVSNGDYRIAFQQIEPGKPPASTPKLAFTLHWSTVKAVPIPDIPAGLYQINVETTDGDSVGDAWILAVSPQEFPAKTASFAEVTKTTSGWVSSVPASGVRAVNRAALDHLSRSSDQLPH